MKAKNHSDKIREQQMTYDEYANLPDDGNRYELSNGFLQAMSPSPHPLHQLVSQELAYVLKQSCQNEYVILTAPIDVIFSEMEVRQPDIVMIHKDGMDIVTNKGIEGSPDLVAEIISPSSVKRDRKDKSADYAAFGIAEYWLIDPIQKALEQYLLVDGSYKLHELYINEQLVHTNHLPCVSFSMNAIFENIPPLPNA